MNRREFLTISAGATAGAAAASGTAAAAEGGDDGGGGGRELPDFGGYLSEANNRDDIQDLRGSDEVTVEVGAGSQGFAFAPAGIWVDPGTTVIWEWTGNGGRHNVHATSGAEFVSETTGDEGFTFEQTFEGGGIIEYQCDPHAQTGMLGAVAIGDDVPTQVVAAQSGPEEVDPEHMGVPFQPHFVGVATLLGTAVTLVLTFFFLKYGTSPNTGYPGDR